MARRINLDKYGAGIFKRTEMYAVQVGKQFESAVERLLKLTRSVELGEGELFSFSYNNRMGREANAILRDLYANVYQQIKNGATMEWEYANMSADALIRSIFGKVAYDNHFARYFLRNQEAMDAFFERKTAGLNLSQRVWNCTGQLKDEMELALSVAMGKGESASTISRQVRQYLQEPDKLFRRVRDEKGNLKLSKAAAAYHPGQGVYRSSYKNAMRLTRTETNMAYRSADHERWQRMNFVIGIEIQTSGNHPDEDICDELAGVYPKDFKFVGWHPQCRCFATPVLADEQSMMDWSEKVMRGEAGINDFKAQQITEMPENFTKWMETNADRIENAAHKPYFLTDNEDVINRKPADAEMEQSESESKEKTDEIGGFLEKAESMGVEHYDVAERTDTGIDAIINSLGGGDMTEGSCSSLAYAYAGNRAGFDVADFRGGDSRLLFARRANTQIIAESYGYIEETKNEIKAVNKLLQNMEDGKEYILHTGSHAAVVRNHITEDGRRIRQYLELQTESKNGWYPLTDWSLKYRFSSRARRKMLVKNMLVDIEKLQNDANFENMLGYINTPKGKRLRGKSGRAK